MAICQRSSCRCIQDHKKIPQGRTIWVNRSDEFEKLEEKNNRIQKMNRGLQNSIKKRFNLK